MEYPISTDNTITFKTIAKTIESADKAGVSLHLRAPPFIILDPRSCSCRPCANHDEDEDDYKYGCDNTD